MKKFLQKKLKNEKGLTLVELLAVIVILGIIAAIAVPSIGGIIESSRVKAVKADAQTALSAANIYFTELVGTEGDGTKTQTVTVSTLVSEGYLDDVASFTKGDVTITKGSTGKANTINGSGYYSTDKEVKFNNATNKMISESGKSKTVPK